MANQMNQEFMIVFFLGLHPDYKTLSTMTI